MCENLVHIVRGIVLHADGPAVPQCVTITRWIYLPVISIMFLNEPQKTKRTNWIDTFKRSWCNDGSSRNSDMKTKGLTRQSSLPEVQGVECEVRHPYNLQPARIHEVEILQRSDHRCSPQWSALQARPHKVCYGKLIIIDCVTPKDRYPSNFFIYGNISNTIVLVQKHIFLALLSLLSLMGITLLLSFLTLPSFSMMKEGIGAGLFSYPRANQEA